MLVQNITPPSYTDDFVVDCARVSYAKRADQYTAEQNAKLIKYLNNPPAGVPHWAPFAGPRICFRITQPMDDWMIFFSTATLAGFSWARIDDDALEISGSLWAWKQHAAYFPGIVTQLRERFPESLRDTRDFEPHGSVHFYECSPGHINTMYANLRIRAPIFVARQLVKHQVHLVWSEVSRRYVQDVPELYWPEKWHKAPTHSKQGASDEEFEPKDAMLSNAINLHAADAVEYYTGLLEQGLAPEEARIFLPHNLMTEWIWTGSLAAFARVCRERLAASAQGATREVAALIDRELSDSYRDEWAFARKTIS